jgi:uncharacterized membrane protein YraQ (UPF0718 family)
MLCSCCVAPVFTSVAEASGRIGPAITLMLASPSLNPAAMVLTFMLFQTKIAALRLVMALAAVSLIGPVIEWIYRGRRAVSPEPPAETSESFLKSIGAVSLRTIPGIVIGVLLSMAIVQSIPPQALASRSAQMAAVLITATIAVPLALPTFLEIPLSLGLLAVGLPVGSAVALLFAGPAINLPSLFSVARISGWKAAAILAASVWCLAVFGGILAGS